MQQRLAEVILGDGSLVVNSIVYANVHSIGLPQIDAHVCGLLDRIIKKGLDHGLVKLGYYGLDKKGD